jgi:hypothetical protein
MALREIKIGIVAFACMILLGLGELIVSAHRWWTGKNYKPLQQQVQQQPK